MQTGLRTEWQQWLWPVLQFVSCFPHWPLQFGCFRLLLLREWINTIDSINVHASLVRVCW
jgi:hypothetical protein